MAMPRPKGKALAIAKKVVPGLSRGIVSVPKSTPSPDYNREATNQLAQPDAAFANVIRKVR